MQFVQHEGSGAGGSIAAAGLDPHDDLLFFVHAHAGGGGGSAERARPRLDVQQVWLDVHTCSGQVYSRCGWLFTRAAARCTAGCGWMFTLAACTPSLCVEEASPLR